VHVVEKVISRNTDPQTSDVLVKPGGVTAIPRS
jgi:hypothetical protein